MFTTFIHFALPLAFTVMVACVLTSLASGLVLFFLRRRATNEIMRHPYLDHQSWDRYPLPIRLSIMMDYFFRLCFPNTQFWIIGNANRLLAHVNPAEVSSRIKWPLIGLWGGCFVGIIAMLVLWCLIFITMA